MELRIRDSQNIIDKYFGDWMISNIRSKLISNMSKYSLQTWDNYLTNSEDLTRLYKRNYKTSDLIIFAANNIVCVGTNGDISIQFDNKKFVPGFDRINLNTLVKTINYGNLTTKSCPIFTDTFDYFAKNIDDYVRLYYMI